MDHICPVQDTEYRLRLCNLDFLKLRHDEWQSFFDDLCWEARHCRLRCMSCHERPGRPRYNLVSLVTSIKTRHMWAPREIVPTHLQHTA
eukprot:7806999-Prorocentrum_lima.AAC.1